ncbi:MAG TPA: hypothetical protein VE621_14585 [Bryobacteraceae bacterium]|nr:hypothetical protein [Bryobacteraceae bacterium]
MSIDLATRIDGPVDLHVLLPEVAQVLQEILQSCTKPVLTLNVLEKGRIIPAETGDLTDRRSPYFLVSIEGRYETVGVTSDGEFANVAMAAQRTKLEYALGAAVAIRLAQRFGGAIEDAWRFFNPSHEVSAQDLLDRLKTGSRFGPADDLEFLAEQLPFAQEVIDDIQ